MPVINIIKYLVKTFYTRNNKYKIINEIEFHQLDFKNFEKFDLIYKYDKWTEEMIK